MRLDICDRCGNATDKVLNLDTLSGIYDLCEPCQVKLESWLTGKAECCEWKPYTVSVRDIQSDGTTVIVDVTKHSPPQYKGLDETFSLSLQWPR